MSVFVSGSIVLLFLFPDKLVFQDAGKLRTSSLDINCASYDSVVMVFYACNLFAVVEVYLMACQLVV